MIREAYDDHRRSEVVAAAVVSKKKTKRRVKRLHANDLRLYLIQK